MIIIRPETFDDYSSVYEVNKLAFGRENEAKLVEAIRKTEGYINKLSLVAVLNDLVIGHLLLSRIIIRAGSEDVNALALAPIAIKPEFQNQGIGSELIKRGIEKGCELGEYVIVVLGHPEYYPKFGFVPASTKGITAPFPVPDDAFMIYEYNNSLNGRQGIVVYPSVFLEV